MSQTQHYPDLPICGLRDGSVTLLWEQPPPWAVGVRGWGAAHFPLYLSFSLLSTAPAQAQIIHAGQACVVKEDNISERVYTIREGDTLVLQCLVTGHPRPQVSFWFCLSPVFSMAFLCSVHVEENCGQWGAQLSPTC